ncbi:MAG: prepilin peptidase [Candidatus Peribacteria bacterium]|jgi:prepilin signal peptidase PulO-like enzyme (type II secretory pathway)|nr:prepilin peptidase [Candidatus Peribacteria bacterium]
MKHSEYGMMGIEEVLSYPYIWYLMIGLRLLFIITLYDFKEYELHLTASFLLLILSFGGQWGEGHNLQSALQGMFIFFAVFLIIYYGAKGYVFLRFKQKAEGFGFGDVLMAGILGSIFPIFLPLSSALQRGHLVCSYLIVSCSIGILGYAIGKVFSPSTPTSSHHPQIKIPITSSSKILPFLPAMNIAFVLFVLFGQHLLKLLAYFSSSNAFF